MPPPTCRRVGNFTPGGMGVNRGQPGAELSRAASLRPETPRTPRLQRPWRS